MPAYSLIGIFASTTEARCFEKLQVQFIFQILLQQADLSSVFKIFQVFLPTSRYLILKFSRSLSEKLMILYDIIFLFQVNERCECVRYISTTYSIFNTSFSCRRYFTRITVLRFISEDRDILRNFLSCVSRGSTKTNYPHDRRMQESVMNRRDYK